MENTAPSLPTKQLPLHILIPVLTLLFGLVALSLFLYANKQQHKLPIQTELLNNSSSSISYKITEGFVESINPNSILVRENNHSLVEVSVSIDSPVKLDIINIPAQKISSNSAQVISTLVSSKSVSLKDLKVNDKVRITLEENNNKYQAKSITVIKEQAQ